MQDPSIKGTDMQISEVHVSAPCPLCQRGIIPTEGSLVSVFRFYFRQPKNQLIF